MNGAAPAILPVAEPAPVLGYVAVDDGLAIRRAWRRLRLTTWTGVLALSLTEVLHWRYHSIYGSHLAIDTDSRLTSDYIQLALPRAQLGLGLAAIVVLGLVARRRPRQVSCWILVMAVTINLMAISVSLLTWTRKPTPTPMPQPVYMMDL